MWLCEITQREVAEGVYYNSGLQVNPIILLLLVSTSWSAWFVRQSSTRHVKMIMALRDILRQNCML